MARVDGETKNNSIIHTAYAESARALQARLDAYTRWVNSQLKKHSGKKVVTDLRSDLQDGVVISELIEILSGEKVTGIDNNPSTSSGYKDNVDRVFQFLLSKQVPIPIASARDVVEGDLKTIMRLIHAVASHYRPDSVLHPTSRCATSLGHNVSSEQLNRNMNRSLRSSATSPGRQPKQLATNRKVIGGTTLPIRRQPLSTREVQRAPSASLPLDRTKNNLRKSLSSLNAERLARGGGEVDGASCNGSPTPSELAQVSCKVASLQINSRSALTNSKRRLLLSRSEPCSLDSADLEKTLKIPIESPENKAFSCSCLNDELIDQLLQDIKEAKQQLLHLQGMLLNGSNGKFSQKLDRAISYGSVDKADAAESRPITQENPKNNDDVNTKRTKITEPTSMVKKLINYISVCTDRKGKTREEPARVTSITKETPTTYRKNLEEENEKLLKTIDEKDQEIKRLKGALSSQVIGFDKVPKYSFSMPPRPQREELQVVHEALTSLRRCFPVNDPYQHTLDTIEQSLSALLERVNSLEMSTGSSPTKSAVLASTSEADPLHGLVHSVNFDPSGDARRLPVTKLSGLGVRHTEHNRTRNEASTKVVYYMDKSATPFRCVLHKRIGEATLRDFKMLFDRPGQYRYHFKTLDPEFGMVKEEMLYDDDVLPGWDGKVIAWVEEESS